LIKFAALIIESKKTIRPDSKMQKMPQPFSFFSFQKVEVKNLIWKMMTQAPKSFSHLYANPISSLSFDSQNFNWLTRKLLIE